MGERQGGYNMGGSLEGDNRHDRNGRSDRAVRNPSNGAQVNNVENILLKGDDAGHENATVESHFSTNGEKTWHTPTSTGTAIAGTGLRLQTDVAPYISTHVSAPSLGGSHSTAHPRDSKLSSYLSQRSDTSRANLSASSSFMGSLSPSSAISSPALGPMADITPLPSPVTSSDSPGPWKRLSTRSERSASALSQTSMNSENSARLPGGSSPPKRKAYPGLGTGGKSTTSTPAVGVELNGIHHTRDRSISDYVPDSIQVPRQRIVTVNHAPDPTQSALHNSSESRLKREEYLAEQRGVSAPKDSDEPDNNRIGASNQLETLGISPERKLPDEEYFTANRLKDGQKRSWRMLRTLGRGTFSKVFLATAQDLNQPSEQQNGTSEISRPTSRLAIRDLVAVKIVEHGPAGGASEERIEHSLKRELDILKSIQHPSLVHLKALSIESTRALLILTYCPGGDMFEVADRRLELLTPPLIRRIFAELVSATQYLHDKMIVHRDIKLENVLLHIPCERLPDIKDWQTYPYAVVMLTDLGLSRRIDPSDPRLYTRCGTEEYASPEVLLGEPYDGRQTDAWALGALLYAIMEGRLPFDPLPGMPEHQRTRRRIVHRIARCDWSWFRYADDEGEPGDFGELAPAQRIVEGLLKRATRRLDLKRVAENDWVRSAIHVDGGIRFGDDSDGFLP